MDRQTQRIAYWDNAKAVLIALVVLGHFLLPMRYDNVPGEIVYNWIHLFHMPAFVFTSGFFAKSYVRRGGSDTNRLIGFLVLYVCFMLAIWIIQVVLSKTLYLPNFFSTTMAPWYLLCMCLWYLVIPHFARIHPAWAISLTVLTALLIGAVIPDGAFLSLSRFFVFLPFFLAGYYFSDQWFYKTRPRAVCVSVIVLLGFFLLCWFGRDFIEPYVSLLYGNYSYERISLTRIQGMIGRLIWYGAAAAAAFAFFCVIPKRRTFFTFIGERTLAIYILHRLIRELFDQLGLYQYLGDGLPALLACLIISIAVTLVCSGRRVSALMNRALTIPWTGSRQLPP